MKKKVLIIAYYFPPTGGGGIARTVKLAKYLPAYDWEPHVLTVRGIQYHSIDPAPLDDISNVKIYRSGSFDPLRLAYILRGGARPQSPDEIRSFRELENRSGRSKPISSWKRHIKNIIDIFIQPDIAILWAPIAIIWAVYLSFKLDIDVLYTTSPQESTHFIGWAASKLTGKKWVADFRDPWAKNSWRSKHPLPLRKLNQWFELSVMKAANGLVLNTEPFYNEYKQKLPDKPYFTFINNGYDAEDFNRDNLTKQQDDFVIVHIGNFNGDLRADTIIEGFDKACNVDKEFARRAKLYLVGANQQEDIDLIKQLDLADKIFDAGYVAFRDAVNIANSADLNIMYKGNNTDPVLVPGKFYIYLGTKKPILAIVPDGATRQLGERICSCFYVANPDDVLDIRDQFIEAFNTKCDQIISDDAVKEYEYRYITGKMTAFFDKTKR